MKAILAIIAVSLLTGKWQYNEDFAIDSNSVK
jgi:hypothetical protein